MTNPKHPHDSTWDASMSLRQQLAATCGQDGETPLPESLRRELSTSPEARQMHASMKSSLAALTEAAEESAELPRPIWPELKSRLPQPTVPLSRHKRTWQEIKETYVPIFSSLAACLAIGVVLYESQFSRNDAIYKTPTVQNPVDSAIAPASLDQSPLQQTSGFNAPSYQWQPQQWKTAPDQQQLLMLEQDENGRWFIKPGTR